MVPEERGRYEENLSQAKGFLQELFDLLFAALNGHFYRQQQLSSDSQKGEDGGQSFKVLKKMQTE